MASSSKDVPIHDAWPAKNSTEIAIFNSQTYTFIKNEIHFHLFFILQMKNLRCQEINVFITMEFPICKKYKLCIEDASVMTPMKYNSGYFWVLILQMVSFVFQRVFLLL